MSVGVEARVNLFRPLHLFALALALSPAVVAGAEESPPAAQAACEEGLLERVQAWADAMRGFEADFEQVSQPVALGGGAPPPAMTSRGRVYLARPGRMRWNYEQPTESQVVSDGRELWIYEPASREAQHLAATQGFLDAAALEFLMGEGRLAESFEVSAPRCDGEEAEMDLVPRVAASYEKLGLRVRSKTGEVVATTLIDLLGNRTRVRFEGAQTDRIPAASHFRFEVPEGVEVLEMRPVLPSSEPTSQRPTPGS